MAILGRPRAFRRATVFIRPCTPAPSLGAKTRWSRSAFRHSGLRLYRASHSDARNIACEHLGIFLRHRTLGLRENGEPRVCIELRARLPDTREYTALMVVTHLSPATLRRRRLKVDWLWGKAARQCRSGVYFRSWRPPTSSCVSGWRSFCRATAKCSPPASRPSCPSCPSSCFAASSTLWTSSATSTAATSRRRSGACSSTCSGARRSGCRDATTAAPAMARRVRAHLTNCASRALALLSLAAFSRVHSLPSSLPRQSYLRRLLLPPANACMD